MKKIEVVFFQRKPYSTGNYSIEFIFEDVRNRLKSKIEARVFKSTFYSRGFLRRLYNTIEVIFKQGEVNLITGDIHYISLLLNKKKTILTILDCGFLYDTTGITRWLQNLFWLQIPVKRVKYITTISENTKNDILRYTNCDPSKIIVIPVSIDDQYQYYPKQFNEKKPVLLQVGQAENKNLSRIIEAIKDLQVQLSIVGVISSKNLQLLKKYNIDYINIYNISNHEMLQEYIKCDILIFPSTFEGFGMPILEAQAVGRPVITSNVTSMPWVAGDAACIVDPFSVESIREGIIKILNDQKYCQELIAKGLENVKRFNPNLIANMYFDLIQKYQVNN